MHLESQHGGGQLTGLHVAPGVELLAHDSEEGGSAQPHTRPGGQRRAGQQACGREGHRGLEHLVDVIRELALCDGPRPLVVRLRDISYRVHPIIPAVDYNGWSLSWQEPTHQSQIDCCRLTPRGCSCMMLYWSMVVHDNLRIIGEYRQCKQIRSYKPSILNTSDLAHELKWWESRRVN